MLISIQPMELKDLREVVALEQQVFRKPWKLRDFEWEVRHNRDSAYRVVRAGEKIIGYGGIWLTGGRAHLTTLGVHPDYRRRGVGTLILNHFLVMSGVKGARIMTLEVRISNEIAQRFYQNFGFKVQGIHPNYYFDEDAYVMKIPLSGGPA